MRVRKEPLSTEAHWELREWHLKGFLRLLWSLLRLWLRCVQVAPECMLPFTLPSCASCTGSQGTEGRRLSRKALLMAMRWCFG